MTLLPESIGLLVKLTTLDVSSNDLTTLPSSLGFLISLGIDSFVLIFFNEELMECCFSFYHFMILEVLNLARNDLTALPRNLGTLKASSCHSLEGKLSYLIFLSLVEFESTKSNR